MSEQYLSQEEIDALLDAPEGAGADAPASADADTAATGDGDAAAAAPLPAMTVAGNGEARPYDLARQERIVRGRMPALELIHERFARSFGLAMFGN